MVFIRSLIHKNILPQHCRHLECIALCRKYNENWTLMRVLEVLAQWYLEQKDYPAAQKALEESMALTQSAGDKNTLEKALKTKGRLEAALIGEATFNRLKNHPNSTESTDTAYTGNRSESRSDC